MQSPGRQNDRSSTAPLLQEFKKQPPSHVMADREKESKCMMELGENLLSAARDRNVKKVRAAIQFGADVNYQDPTTGKTALMIIAARPSKVCENVLTAVADSVAIAKMLLAEDNIDCNLQDNSGKTALMHVVVGDDGCPAGREKMTIALLSSYAGRHRMDANLTDKKGKTALDYFIANALDRGTHKGVILVADKTKRGAVKYKVFEAEIEMALKLERESERIMDEAYRAEHPSSWWNCLC